MTDYNSIEEMMNTTENMEHLVNNVSHDDDTMTFDGVDWFFFNGVRASNIYVSGNSWVGIGSNSEQLLVCRRDTKMWQFYREEATLFDTYKVLKIRWEGYAQYNSTSQDVALKYEWFFVETGDIFLNLIQPPSNAGYLGTTKVAGSVNQTFNITAGQQTYITLHSLDDTGTAFECEYGILDVDPPFEHRYLLCDKDGKYYRTEHDKAFVDAIIMKGYQFIRTGIIPDQNTKIEISFNTTKFNDAALCGARLSTSADKFGIFLSSSVMMNGQFATESLNADVDDYSGRDVVVLLSKEGLFRDGVVIADFTDAEFTAPCELTVGTINTNETLDTRYFSGTIYYIKVWQGEEQVLDLIPCVDENVHPCFYDTLSGVCYYNDGFSSFGFIDSHGEYDICTRLVEVEVAELTASIFHKEGFVDFPRSEVLTRLVNPELLYWQDSETELPVYKVDIDAMPPTQVIYSKNNEMTDSTILGIESAEAEADETTLFAFSFDGGETWKAYINNEWVSLSEETSGMNYETLAAIGTDAWAIANETMQYMVRFTIFEGGYMKKLTIHYLN